MAMLEARQKQVFYAPTARRHFMTRKAAALREAAAIIQRKYPTEPMEYDNIGRTYPGFHWKSDERLVRVHRRLVRILSRQAKPSPLSMHVGVKPPEKLGEQAPSITSPESKS